MAIKCFEKYGKPKLQGELQTLVDKGMNEYEAARQIFLREYKNNFDALTGLRKQYNELVDKKSQLKIDDYKEPEPVSEKVKQVEEKYSQKQEAEPPKEPPKPPKAEKPEDTEGGITHAANEVRRKNTGLPEYESKAESFEEWTSEAENKLKNGYDVESLIDRIEQGHDPNPVENAIRKIYIATLDAEIAKNPTDELLAKQKRFIEIGDLANSRAGRNLVSLKGENSPLDSLSDFYVAKMQALGVDKLTEQQKKDTKEAYDNVKKADKSAEEAILAYKEEIERLKAENELLKQKKQAKTTEKKDYKTEREQIKKSIKEKWKNAGKDILSSDIPYRKQLAAIAPDVAKLFKSYAEEGITELKTMVSKLYDDLKEIIPNITESDVTAIIAGEYNEKKPTRSALSATLKDLRDEAYYINKLEKLMSGEEPKTEAKKTERNKNIKELQDKIKEFKKDKPLTDSEIKAKLAQIKKRNEEKEQQILKRIREGDFVEKEEVAFMENPEFKKRFPKEYNAALDAIVKREEARHEFDIALFRDQQAKRSWKEKRFDDLSKVAGTAKAIVTGIDDSAVAIQTYMSLLVRPRTGIRAFGAHISHAFSQKRFNRWLAALHNSSDYEFMRDAGLDVTEPQSLKELEKEEIFSNRFDGTIKIKGKEYKLISAPLKPFERAFTTLGNVTRVVGFRTIAAKYMREGYTWEKDPELFKSLARRLNTETGRGKVNEYVEMANKVVTLGIWSPRLMASKFNLLGVSDLASVLLSKAGTKGYYSQLHPKERAAAIRDISQFAITVGALSYLFALAFGGDLDDDPLSSTFMDVKLPNGKSYNFTGGFSSYIRNIAQFSTGYASRDGQIKEVNRLNIASRFFRGKTPPITSSVINILNEKSFMGEPVTIESELRNVLTPISMRNIVEQVKNDGAESFFTQGIPTFFGFNIKDEKDYQRKSSYTPEQIKETSALKLIQDKGIDLPVPASKNMYDVTKDEKHPEGKMTDKEYENFVEEWKKTMLEKLKGFEDEQRKINKYNEYGQVSETETLTVKELSAEDLKNELSELKKEVTKEVKKKLGIETKKIKSVEKL